MAISASQTTATAAPGDKPLRRRTASGAGLRRSSGSEPDSGPADSRVEESISGVNHEVDRDEPDRDHEHSTLNSDVVAVVDRVNEHRADAGEAKDLLDDDRPSDQVADRQAK